MLHYKFSTSYSTSSVLASVSGLDPLFRAAECCGTFASPLLSMVLSTSGLHTSSLCLGFPARCNVFPIFCTSYHSRELGKEIQILTELSGVLRLTRLGRNRPMSALNQWCWGRCHGAVPMGAGVGYTAPGLQQGDGCRQGLPTHWSLSPFCRRTAGGPKRKPLPWRRRWHWPRSSCEPGGRSRKSAAPWAVSSELWPWDPGWDGARP